MTCKTHPDAPHGFLRDASHSEDRYVCECEFWEPPEEEPVAFASHGVVNWIADKQFQHEADLYAHPQPKREWVGLTDEERLTAIWTDGTFGAGVKWAEAKLKEKNT